MDSTQSKKGSLDRGSSVAAQQEPIKINRLSHPGDSPTESRNSQGLDPPASPFPSFQNFNNPFHEEGYSPQLFRPDVYEEAQSDDPHYSPPPSFIPPEPPNEACVETQTSSAGMSAESQTIRSSSSKPYTRAALPPGQHHSLTTYRVFGPLASSSDSIQGRYTEEDLLAAASLASLHLHQDPFSLDQSPANNPMARHPSLQRSVNSSNYSSDPDVHSSSGVPLHDTNTFPLMWARQTHTFDQLVAEQGLQEWNNSHFDDRWILRPEEMWKPDGNWEADLTVSPERHPLDSRNVRAERRAQHTAPSPTLLSQQERYDRLNRKFREIRIRNGVKSPEPYERPKCVWPMENSLVAYKRLMGPPEERNKAKFVDPPPDVQRLRDCIRDLQDGPATVPPELVGHPKGIRKYFYELVFHDPYPTRIRGPEGEKMTDYDGRKVTLADLRDTMLKDIDDLVDFVLSPVGEEIRSKTSNSVGNSSNTCARVIGLSPRQPFKEQLASVESRNSSRNQLHSHGRELYTTHMPIDQRRNVKPANLEETMSLPQGYGDRYRSSEKAYVSHEEAVTYRKANIDRFRAGTSSKSRSRHNSLAQPMAGPIQHTATEATTPRPGQGHNFVPKLSREPSDDGNLGQTQVGHAGSQSFQFGVQPHQIQLYTCPGTVFATPPFPSQIPPTQQPWGIQQPTDAFQQPAFSASQVMPYGYNAWRIPYAQPAPGYPAYQQHMAGQSAYVTPPAPWGMNTVLRAPADSRVARVFAQNPSFQEAAAAHSLSIPAGVAQNTEWQNRYGSQPTVVPNIPVLPYRVGCDAMYPQATAMASIRYQNLTRDSPTPLDVATAEENVPFVENARMSKPAEWGVLKIGNIPYDLTKGAILTFLGPHAKIITTDLGPPIHIIMDRSTGKTMDCYVEFFSTPDARACANSISLRPNGQNRIGDRVVDVFLSSQEELMRDLFPKAKNVKWNGAKPVVMEATEMFNSGFKSFVSSEELGCLIRHAEQPHRSNYTQRSPQRTYESLISLLAKFPWFAVDHYTLATRTQMFQSTRQMLHILSINIRKVYNTLSTSYTSPVSPLSYGAVPVSHGGVPLLTEALLKDLLLAGLNAPGFSEKQRWELFEMSDYARHHFRVSPLLQHWPFEVLGRKMNVEENVVEFYARLVSNNPLTDHPNDTATPFGSIKHLTQKLDLDACTMDKVGEMERKMLFALVAGGIAGGMNKEWETLMPREGS